jgi:hypothetical protein
VSGLETDRLEEVFFRFSDLSCRTFHMLFIVNSLSVSLSLNVY